MKISFANKANIVLNKIICLFLTDRISNYQNISFPIFDPVYFEYCKDTYQLVLLQFPIIILKIVQRDLNMEKNQQNIKSERIQLLQSEQSVSTLLLFLNIILTSFKIHQQEGLLLISRVQF
ncbi:unnamed protein product [Paramecium pentaurelia]|uniref:Uncharacterized protein n=1 Tax=Paramecium pentaurelia TaxID=43138 RepID=A0A8S1V5X2_9CILI|nr:unnamed protein product [Paramecium pentaurelia]